MIRVERTADCSLIEAVVKHPKVWRLGLLHDAIPLRENWRFPEGMLCLIVYEFSRVLGGFAMEEMAGDTWRAHLALLPVAWGSKSSLCCEAVIAWMKENTQAKLLLADVPQYNSLCRALVKRIGMQETQTFHGLYQKDGKPQDAYRYVLVVR